LRIVYLPSTRAGLAWLRRYYATVFPAGNTRAKQQFHAMERVLREHPQAGQPTAVAGVRRLVIPRTPFSLVYRVTAERIEVLEVRDERRPPGAERGRGGP
jgi:plasmid stabilization system protein ParE